MNRGGRPELDIVLIQILESVRRHRKVTAAALELGWSDAYIRVSFRGAGLTLGL